MATSSIGYPARWNSEEAASSSGVAAASRRRIEPRSWTSPESTGGRRRESRTASAAVSASQKGFARPPMDDTKFAVSHETTADRSGLPIIRNAIASRVRLDRVVVVKGRHGLVSLRVGLSGPTIGHAGSGAVLRPSPAIPTPFADGGPELMGCPDQTTSLARPVQVGSSMFRHPGELRIRPKDRPRAGAQGPTTPTPRARRHHDRPPRPSGRLRHNRRGPPVTVPSIPGPGTPPRHPHRPPAPPERRRLDRPMPNPRGRDHPGAAARGRIRPGADGSGRPGRSGGGSTCTSRC